MFHHSWNEDYTFLLIFNGKKEQKNTDLKVLVYLTMDYNTQNCDISEVIPYQQMSVWKYLKT